MYIEWIIIRSTFGLFKVTPNISHNSLLEMKYNSKIWKKLFLDFSFYWILLGDKLGERFVTLARY